MPRGREGVKEERGDGGTMAFRKKRTKKRDRGIALGGLSVIAPPIPRRVQGSRVGAKSITRMEYLVTWQREGLTPKSKRFSNRKRAYDWIGIMASDQPWRYYGSASDRARSGGDYHCCNGRYGCSCSGMTVQEAADIRRAEFPSLLWWRVETRHVTRTAWDPVDGAVLRDVVADPFSARHLGDDIPF